MYVRQFLDFNFTYTELGRHSLLDESHTERSSAPVQNTVTSRGLKYSSGHNTVNSNSSKVKNRQYVLRAPTTQQLHFTSRYTLFSSRYLQFSSTFMLFSFQRLHFTLTFISHLNIYIIFISGKIYIPPQHLHFISTFIFHLNITLTLFPCEHLHFTSTFPSLILISCQTSRHHMGSTLLTLKSLKKSYWWCCIEYVLIKPQSTVAGCCIEKLSRRQASKDRTGGASQGSGSSLKGSYGWC